MKDHKPIERFLKFVDVKDRSAIGLSSILVNEIHNFDRMSEKLIAQTYDGAALMSGSRG